MRGLPASNYNGIDSVFPIRFSPCKKREKWNYWQTLMRKESIGIFRNKFLYMLAYFPIGIHFLYQIHLYKRLAKIIPHLSDVVILYTHYQEPVFFFLLFFFAAMFVAKAKFPNYRNLEHKSSQ